MLFTAISIISSIVRAHIIHVETSMLFSNIARDRDNTIYKLHKLYLYTPVNPGKQSRCLTIKQSRCLTNNKKSHKEECHFHTFLSMS